MNVATLTRFGSTPMGTFGELRFGTFTAYTVERPWIDNEHSISSIPLGVYTCQLRNMSGTHLQSVTGMDYLYEVTKVAARDGIFIHPANYANQLQGCIALGKTLGCVDGQWAVLSSKDAVTEFNQIMGGDDFVLSVERA